MARAQQTQPDDHVQLLLEAVRREPCVWVDPDWIGQRMWASDKCLRLGCTAVVTTPGTRALFFRNRNRGMCEPCGATYLKIAV